MRPRTPQRVPLGIRLFLLPLAWLLLAANLPDDLREVVTHTVDPDGASRARRVWFVHLDDVLYVRTTPAASWGKNALRTGRIGIASELARVEYGAVLVETESEARRVHARFREKYGARDAGADVVRFFFGGKVVLRLELLSDKPSPPPAID